MSSKCYGHHFGLPLLGLVVGGFLVITSCESKTPEGLDEDNPLVLSGSLGGWIEYLVTNSQGHLFAAVYPSIFTSENDGETWIETSAPKGVVWNLVIDSQDNMFASIEGEENHWDLYRSTDNGQNWKGLGINDVCCLSIFFNASGAMYVEIRPGLFRSDDLGDTWVSTGLDSAMVVAGAVNESGHIFVGVWHGLRGDFLRSTDGGATWTNLGLGDDYSHVVFPNPGVVLVGHPWHDESGGGISRSMDNGITWDKHDFHDNGIFGLAVDSEGSIFAAIYPSFLSDTPLGVYRSIDNGGSWAHVLKDSFVTTLFIGSSDQIYVGTNYGSVIYSTDKGENWH